MYWVNPNGGVETTRGFKSGLSEFVHEAEQSFIL